MPILPSWNFAPWSSPGGRALLSVVEMKERRLQVGVRWPSSCVSHSPAEEEGV